MTRDRRTDRRLTSALKPLLPGRSATLSILDIGTSKVVCLIAQLRPAQAGDALRGRSHIARVVGIGHQRSLGLKGGAIVDLEATEQAIRGAVDAAERMAKVEVRSVIVNLTAGRLSSQRCFAEVFVSGDTVSEGDARRAFGAACENSHQNNRAVLHALPTTFSLDGQSGVLDPVGMLGERLGVTMHVATADTAVARNIMLAVERCHLGVEAVVATPYASGLSVLVDDEAEMGAVVIDFGGGTTSLGVFSNGSLVHVDAVAVGSHHVTMDIARGLSTRVSTAERLKIRYGSTISTASDERETIAAPQVDEDERDIPHHVPLSHLTRIIRPRIEEIVELVRNRLTAAGFGSQAGRRIILTGGGSGLNGLSHTVNAVFKGEARIGRPLGIKGLPEAAKGPAFAVAAGLLVYPQVADLERFEVGGDLQEKHTHGYLSRVGRWIKESF